MIGDKKRMGIIIAVLAVLIIAAIVYSINTKDSKGNKNDVPESATTEDVISGTTENTEINTGEEPGADKDGTEPTVEGDKDKTGKDSKEDKDKKASEATILDNQGDVEIIIPDEMGDGGF